MCNYKKGMDPLSRCFSCPPVATWTLIIICVGLLTQRVTCEDNTATTKNPGTDTPNSETTTPFIEGQENDKPLTESPNDSTTENPVSDGDTEPEAVETTQSADEAPPSGATESPKADESETETDETTESAIDTYTEAPSIDETENLASESDTETETDDVTTKAIDTHNEAPIVGTTENPVSDSDIETEVDATKSVTDTHTEAPSVEPTESPVSDTDIENGETETKNEAESSSDPDTEAPPISTTQRPASGGTEAVTEDADTITKESVTKETTDEVNEPDNDEEPDTTESSDINGAEPENQSDNPDSNDDRGDDSSTEEVAKSPAMSTTEAVPTDSDTNAGNDEKDDGKEGAQQTEHDDDDTDELNGNKDSQETTLTPKPTSEPLTTPDNTTLPPPLNPFPIANVTGHDITHHSVTVYWEQLSKEHDQNYRLVGYRLSKFMDVKAKVADLYINASNQTGRHRLTQENLTHHTFYMFCVLPIEPESETEKTEDNPEITDTSVAWNTTDCFLFRTPYNPLNPKAVIAFGFAIFIGVVFLATMISARLYERSKEEVMEEKKSLIEQLKQAKRRRRKENYGSDKSLLSGYKIVDDDEPSSEFDTIPLDEKPVVHDRDGNVIELDKMSMPDDSSDTGYLLDGK